MDKVSLTVEKREKIDKRENIRIRKAGKIPAVVYSDGNSLPITIERTQFEKAFKKISENVSAAKTILA